MGRSKRHVLAVEIECLDTQGSHAAEDRLIKWIESYGHTASDFGFRFFSVGRIASKPMQGRTKKDQVDK